MLESILGALFVSLYALLWVGLPACLASWVRGRRGDIARRQIALTDALHGRLGPIVSPVVRKPLRGPWEILIAVPASRPLAAGPILRVVREVLGPAPSPRDAYRVALTFAPGSPPGSEARISGLRTAGWRGRAA